MDIGSSEFYAVWFSILQYVHVVLFGALLFVDRWRAVAFPLLLSALFYLKTGSLIAYMEQNGFPIESYIFKAVIDTGICASIVAIGWKADIAGWTRQTILLTLFSFIHIAAAVEFPMRGVTVIYSIYLPVTLVLNLLQVLVMYDAISDIRTIPRTISSFRRNHVLQRLFRSLHNTKGVEQ